MRRTHKAAYSAMVLIAFLSLFEGAARVKEMWRPPVEVDYGLGFYGDLDVFVPVDDQRWQTRPSKTETFLPQRISMPKRSADKDRRQPRTVSRERWMAGPFRG